MEKKKKSEYIGINLIPELKDYLLKKAEQEFKSITEVITDFIVQNYKRDKLEFKQDITIQKNESNDETTNQS